MEGEWVQRLGFARGQHGRSRVLAAAWILAIASTLPVRASAEPSPNDGARGSGARTAAGKRAIPSWGARLTLRVYNYVPVAAAVLAGAEKVAEAIFEETGIETTWMDCTPLRGESLPQETCPSEMGASDLVLRLLPRNMAMRLAAPNEPLGFAQPCPEIAPACELTVFYFRVDDLAADLHRPELILGHVMAHELTHVLIGPGHSDDGIMRREWSREQLRRMSLGLQLGFTGEQTRRLQEAALRRMRLPMPETSARADSIAGQSKVGE